MPIQVACRCGQKLAAKDEYAGKTVKCPKCGQPLSIPVPAVSNDVAAAHALLDEIGLSHHIEGQECPECGSDTPLEAILCVNCGYNFKLKRRIHSTGTPPKKKKSAPQKPVSETDKALAKAAMELEHEPIEQDKGYGKGWHAWILMLLLASIAAGVIGGGMYFFTTMEAKFEEKEKQKDLY